MYAGPLLLPSKDAEEQQNTEIATKVTSNPKATLVRRPTRPEKRTRPKSVTERDSAEYVSEAIWPPR